MENTESERVMTQAASAGGGEQPGQRAADLILRNVWVTTSGWFTLPPLNSTRGRALLDKLDLAPADREKIAGGNAERLLGLAKTNAR